MVYLDLTGRLRLLKGRIRKVLYLVYQKNDGSSTGKVAGKFTKTERFLLLLAAVFLTALAVLYLLALKPAAGSDYTVTAQYQTESPQEALVNINTADQEELEALSGIGPALARRIIEHREVNGPFQSVDGLLKVSGIGEGTLAKFRCRVTVG